MLRRLAACLFAISVSIAGQKAVAQPVSDWSSAKKEMESLSLADQADCERAWDLLWQWAKRGEPEARVYLSRAMFLGLDQASEPGPG